MPKYKRKGYRKKKKSGHKNNMSYVRSFIGKGKRKYGKKKRAIRRL